MAFDYGGNTRKTVYGRVVLKKISGAGPVAVGTQFVIPHATAQLRNPDNNSYLTGVNSSGAISGDVPGKRTPSVVIATVIKTSSFFTAALIESLILAVDGNGDTDVWGILCDDLVQPETYDGSKCASIQIRQHSQGGPMTLQMAFLSMYGTMMGTPENPGTLFPPTTFAATTIDAGTVTDVTKITYGNTADQTLSFAMDMLRPQAYVFYDDGTIFPAGIASGVFRGNMVLTQNVNYTQTPSSAATVNIGQTGAGVSFSNLVKRDEDARPFTTGNRIVTRTFSLYDQTNGGIPVTVSAM